jgi:hypothetical protein
MSAMNQRAMNKRKRTTVLISLGAGFICAGFALVPVLSRSAPDMTVKPAMDIAEASVSPAILAEIRPHNDPFVRALPGVSDAKPVRLGPLRKKREINVTAIVAGTVSRALVTFGSGDAQIVKVGDAIDSTRIALISPDEVVLADGRHLVLSETHR